MKMTPLFSVTCLLLFLGFCKGGKYSEDTNQPFDETERPFSMMNVNLIWEKAKKLLPTPRLADLYADLKIQDRVEKELKKLKAANRDEDGLREAEIRQRRLDIMIRYGLNGDAPRPPPGMTNEVPLDDLPPNFHDKKLRNMWKKAELSGFTEEEMKELKQEFWHQQHKLDEFNSLKDLDSSFFDITDNSLDPQKPNKVNDRMKEVDKLRILKDKQKYLNEGYARLDPMNKASRPSSYEFRDPRVYQLWALAKKSNMSSDELESFKTELRHFEQRIEKHLHISHQVSLSEDMLKDQAKEGEFPEKHLEMKQKADDLEKKIQKYHSHLRRTVEKALNRHTEL